MGKLIISIIGFIYGDNLTIILHGTISKWILFTELFKRNYITMPSMENIKFDINILIDTIKLSFLRVKFYSSKKLKNFSNIGVIDSHIKNIFLLSRIFFKPLASMDDISRDATSFIPRSRRDIAGVSFLLKHEIYRP